MWWSAVRKQSFVSVLDIATLQWHRRSSQVVLTTTFDETVTLQGPNGARLAVALWAKGVGRADPSRISGAQVYYEGQATYVSGPMHFRGRIAIGDHGLFWESTGSVEQLVGSPPAAAGGRGVVGGAQATAPASPPHGTVSLPRPRV